MFSCVLYAVKIIIYFLLSTFITFLLILKTSKKIQNFWFAYILDNFIAPKVEKLTASEKQKLLEDLKNEKSKDPERMKEGKIKILEIGPGSGTNFKYYPENVSLICVEPNDNFRKYFEKNKSKFPHVKVEMFLCSGAENMTEVENDSVDVVVSTHVLCSVDNVQKVLNEVKRVLIKGGRFYYLEHQGRLNRKWMMFLFKIIEPIWMILTGDCRISRLIGTDIEKAGFTEISQYYKMIDKFPFMVKFHVFGIAVK